MATERASAQSVGIKSLDPGLFPYTAWDCGNPARDTNPELSLKTPWKLTADFNSARVLAALLPVDGVGSGLDADLLAGKNATSPGHRWDVYTYVGSDGITEIGQQLHFHEFSADISDYVARMYSTGGKPAWGTTGESDYPMWYGGNYARPFKTLRDFINGTLIQTDIDYTPGNTGIAWFLEIKGNTYFGRLRSLLAQAQGYIYPPGIIANGGFSLGGSLSGLVAGSVAGKLWFWFPRFTYWDGYFITVWDANTPGAYRNHVVDVTDAAKPAWSGETTITVNQLDPGYDLIVDSNAALDKWCAAHSGEYPRVYIKRGTWTATTLGASGTANTLIDLTAAGTTVIEAEEGANIQYSGDHAGVLIFGLHRASRRVVGTERIANLKVTMANTSTAGSATCFHNLTGLVGCKASVVLWSDSTIGAFQSCESLIGCVASLEGSYASATAELCGFYDCFSITRGEVFAKNTISCYLYGYRNCHRIANSSVNFATPDFVYNGTYEVCGFKQCSCIAGSKSYIYGGAGNIGTAIGFRDSWCISASEALVTSYGTYNAYGFCFCYDLSSCRAIQAQSYSGGMGCGFYACQKVVASQGKGTGATGYGFAECRGLSMNETVASTTSRYLNCYCDQGTAYPIAAGGTDTPNGGFNT